MTTEFALAARATGPEGRVLTTAAWQRDFDAIRQEQEKMRALALMGRLATIPLELARNLTWFKYPMAHTAGAMEVKADGVRCYGEPVGKLDKAVLLVFEAAERKQPEDKADQALLQRASTVCKAIATRWKALEAAKAAVQAADPKVVHLDAARNCKKRHRR